MPILSKTSYTIVLVIAFLTMTATAIGIWKGSRDIPIIPPDPIKTILPWEQKDPSNTLKFGTNQQAKGMLIQLIQAGKKKDAAAITFLISCLLDRRLLPAAPSQNPDSPTPLAPQPPIKLPEQFKQKKKRWVTVSSIAKELLVSATPHSIQPLTNHLEDIRSKHPKDVKSWSTPELRQLQVVFDTLSSIQFHYLRASDAPPALPPILLIGLAKKEKGDSTNSTQTEPFGIINCNDQTLNANATRPTPSHMAELEVTPKNINALIVDLLKTTTALAEQSNKEK